MLATVRHYENGQFGHPAIPALADQDLTAPYPQARVFADGILAASRG